MEVMSVIGIVRGLTPGQLEKILPLYKNSGLKMLEITMNTAAAEEMIRYAAYHFDQDLLIGAGTVCTLAELERALSAGAKFVVMPVVEESVIRECKVRSIPVYPGAMTPTEILKAWNLGATMVKVFPAATMGSQYFADLRGPLGHIPLLATGGINLDNMDEFRNAGASGFGIGSPLFPKSLIENEDWESLEAHFKKFAAAADQCTLNKTGI